MTKNAGIQWRIIQFEIKSSNLAGMSFGTISMLTNAMAAIFQKKSLKAGTVNRSPTLMPESHRSTVYSVSRDIASFALLMLAIKAFFKVLFQHRIKFCITALQESK